MIKVANNLINMLRVKLAVAGSSQEVKSTTLAGYGADHPFYMHGTPGQGGYYSYGNAPATSMDPERVRDMNARFHPGYISGADYAAAWNTHTSPSMNEGRIRPIEDYPAARQPGSNTPVPFGPYMSQKYERTLGRMKRDRRIAEAIQAARAR